MSCPCWGWTWWRYPPPHDHAEITSFLANRVVLEGLSGIARRRQDERDGTAWDRRQSLLVGRAGEVPSDAGT